RFSASRGWRRLAVTLIEYGYVFIVINNYLVSNKPDIQRARDLPRPSICNGALRAPEGSALGPFVIRWRTGMPRFTGPTHADDPRRLGRGPGADLALRCRPGGDRPAVAAGQPAGRRRRRGGRAPARRRPGAAAISRQARRRHPDERPHGLAAGRGGSRRLPNLVSFRPARRLRPPFHADRDDPGASDYRHPHHRRADTPARRGSMGGIQGAADIARLRTAARRADPALGRALQPGDGTARRLRS